MGTGIAWEVSLERGELRPIVMMELQQVAPCIAVPGYLRTYNARRRVPPSGEAARLAIVLLSETEIEESIRLLFEQHRLVAEGSGALGVGSLLSHRQLCRRFATLPKRASRN